MLDFNEISPFAQVIHYGRQYREPSQGACYPLLGGRVCLLREGEGGADPSLTWWTGWEGDGSCSSQCPYAQARGKRDGQDNLITGGKFM